MSATLINLGHLCSDVRDARGAICCYARACSLLETSAAPSAAPLLAGALVGLGRVYMRLSATDAAITTLERALAIREAVRATPDRLVVVRLLLARALRGRDVHAAVTLATAAVREYELFGDGTGRTRSLGAWLIRFERSCCRAAGQR